MSGKVPLPRPGRCVVMGVLNVTPDSFSDGGCFADAASAIAHGLQMHAAGADFVDVGGESTRPGADRVDAVEECRRVLPVIGELSAAGVRTSVDTTRAEVAEKFPEEAGNWEKDPFTFAPQGGESGLAVTARALPALLEIVRDHPGEKVLVVSHKATIRLLISSLLGFDPRRYRDNLDQSPAALNIVDFKDAARARLTLFNDTSHYAEAGLAIPDVPHHRLSTWWDAQANK